VARSEVALFLAAALLTACKKPQRSTSLPTFLPTAAPATTREDSLGTRARIVPFEALPIDPEASRVFIENHDRPPVAADDVAPPLTLEALEDTARTEARGLDLEGSIHASKLEERERSELSLDLRSGDCVTVIAHGGLGVMEVDAFVVRHGTEPPGVLAQDSRNGQVALVGGLAGCWPFVEPSGTVDVVVQARKGSGRVVYAVYASRLGPATGD
jgi:hypothetical protein